MKYAKQAQGALEGIDQALAQLLNLIKRGENDKAIKFMTEGLLKERYEEMQNIITISQAGSLGARGTGNIGNI